jgi:hypothetical protein
MTLRTLWSSYILHLKPNNHFFIHQPFLLHPGFPHSDQTEYLTHLYKSVRILFRSISMPTKYNYAPAIPLICEYEPDSVESLKHTLKVADDEGIEWSAETRVPVVNPDAKGEAFLHFISRFTRARQLMSWNDGPTLLSKFELHLQGSYQIDWQEIIESTDPGEPRDVAFFEEQVQNLLTDIFAEDEWTEMADYIRSRCKKPKSMTTPQVFARFCHLITTTQQLPNAPEELFSIDEQKRIILHMFPISWITNFSNAGMTTSTETRINRNPSGTHNRKQSATISHALHSHSNSAGSLGTLLLVA